MTRSTLLSLATPILLLVFSPGGVSAGTTSVLPTTPNTRDIPRVRYHEPNWGDNCPPEVVSTTVEGSEILVLLESPPDCVPIPGPQPYSALTAIDRLDPGSYTATVEAPVFGSNAVERVSVDFEVVPAVQCDAADRPAASLLLPYFEANLDDPEGQRTLFAIGSVANQPTLVHVVLWTNWGWPLLSFDTVLPVDGMRTFDIANLLRGDIPQSSLPTAADSGCTTPLTNPTYDAAAVRALFTGQPNPDDSLCYSSPGENAEVATGYVTIDVVRQCSGDVVVDPWDAGYFESDLDASIATQDNVLWGDFYLVLSGQDLAEGETLVSLFADAERYGVPAGSTGTSSYSFYRDHDHRRPLPHAWRARFLDGGAFAAETEILAWTSGNFGPTDCTEPQNQGVFVSFGFQLYDEQGVSLADESLTTVELVRRFQIGEPNPVPRAFGVIDMDATYFNGIIGVPLIEDLQSWMLPIVRAEDRFGIAAGSMSLEDFCRP